MNTAADIRSRLLVIVSEQYGRAEEELIASGLIDSLHAIALALKLEREFDLPPNSFLLTDMRSITALTLRIAAARGNPGAT
jgi:acyl carrier protein